MRLEDVGKEAKLAGWIDTIRDLGGVLFIDLRDQYGTPPNAGIAPGIRPLRKKSNEN